MYVIQLKEHNMWVVYAHTNWRDLKYFLQTTPWNLHQAFFLRKIFQTVHQRHDLASLTLEQLLQRKPAKRSNQLNQFLPMQKSINSFKYKWVIISLYTISVAFNSLHSYGLPPVQQERNYSVVEQQYGQFFLS